MLEAPEDKVVALIQETSRRGQKFAEAKYKELVDAARDALQFGRQLPSSAFRTQHYIQSFKDQEKSVKRVLECMREIAGRGSEILQTRIELLQTIPGMGFLSATMLLAEIGNVEVFSSARELSAFFGLDPAVRQSGKFQADRQRMSKRGSRLARRALHMLAVQSVRQISGSPMNPAVSEFYQKKCETKAKLVALGAVAHKLCKIIFAVLRDNQPYVMRTAEEQRVLFAGTQRSTVA